MAIVSTDIKYKYTVKTGAAGNSTVGTASGSLGKYISTTEIPDATLNALYDDVSGDENAANDVEYRAIAIHNAHGTLTLQNAVVWLSSEVAGGASIAIAIDNVAASAIGASPAQGAQVADESTGPGGSAGSFSSPTTKGGGLSLGNLAAGQCRFVWLRRTAANTAALDNDGVTLRVEGDTAA